MNDNAIELDQTDEEVLTNTVSDDALETSAGAGGKVNATIHTRIGGAVQWCC
jgi:hypothetical protein